MSFDWIFDDDNVNHDEDEEVVIDKTEEDDSVMSDTDKSNSNRKFENGYVKNNKHNKNHRGNEHSATLKIAQLCEKIKELEEKCKTLEEEKSETYNKMLLIKADSENYRKRLIKDKEDAVRLANKGIVADLLPSLDSIDVALSSIADNGIKQGVEMIKSSFLAALGKWGLQTVSPVDKEFDPAECEACLFEEREDVNTEIVLQVLQSGYILHGTVIRPAKVKVAKPLKK